MRSLRPLLAVVAAVLCAACSKGKTPLAHAANAGTLHISGSASAFDTATGSTGICAHFTLQPYIPSASGTPTPSGSPVSFTTTGANNNGAATYTDQVLGCIDGASDSAGYNWGYIVTATSFSDCSTGAPLTNVSPQTVTFNVPVSCKAGVDVTVPMHADVAISSANQGGYVDISAGVNATTVQIGCKQADIASTDGLLHFGESFISSDGGVEPGLVGLDTGAPTQFGGTVHGTNASNVDTYYTGDISPTAVNTIYQTFLNPCADGVSEYADTNHAQCVSDNSGKPAGTVAQLADAFAAVPGQGFAAVSVVSGGLTIYSSVGSGPQIMNAASSPFTPNYNVITTTNLTAPAGYTINGVFIDQSTPLQFLVSATDHNVTPASPVYATLSYGSGGWTLGSFATPTASAISCNGLYATPKSCFVPTGPCGPVCEPQSDTVRGWTDGNGVPASITVGATAGAPAGATWQCSVSRAASADSTSTFTCDCSAPPAGWSCNAISASNCVLTGPCDGATGATPVLVVPKIPDTSLAATNNTIKNISDGSYVYTATELAGGAAVGQPVSGAVYLHYSLDKLCACKPESSTQEVVDFINHKDGNGNYDNVPDCSTTGPTAGACISHDPNVVFGASTSLANPKVQIEFATPTDAKGNPVSLVATVLNWVVGAPLYDHGYGQPSYDHRGGTGLACPAVEDLLTLRHSFAGYTASGASNLNWVIATREYGQRDALPIGSCANVWRTGIKQGEFQAAGGTPTAGSMLWSTYWVGPPDATGNSASSPHNAPHIAPYSPVETANLDHNGVLGDLDCSAGAVFDAHGDGVCLRKVAGKLQIQRYWHDFECALRPHSRMLRTGMSQKSTLSASPANNGNNYLSNPYLLFLPE